MLQCDHYLPPDPYNQIVEGPLREIGFYHVSQIGVVQCQSALVNILIERWRSVTHTFHFLVGECVVTLEDVALILGLPTNGLPVTGPTLRVHWKFLPLLRNFAGIIQFSWGSACLAHLYRALCRATRVDCGVTGIVRISLTDFVVLLTLGEHWMIYKKDSATVPLISFECIEWHASDKLRRQFGLTQDVPHQERNLGEAHGEVLTGPKNQDWSGTHSFWVKHWTNQYSHALVEHMVPSQHQLDIYLHWYRGTYGDHLHLSNIVPQENQECDPIHNQDNQQEQPAPPASPPQPPQTQAQHKLEQFTPYGNYYLNYCLPRTGFHSHDKFTIRHNRKICCNHVTNFIFQ
ncbi:uncharacterized protein DS421_19g649610 [Arachis hypogaea]|uniref:Aminotransferase-like plant mobile domain-containing protein n=1 Tax=Arachis hypogaea TaxID=3818 RepID=A0A6B9V9Y9_ARAHY|nr:uncharacterized protein DS421_19g649610 [Arachis hypogaea]